ncbi:hypothetical protein DV736_g6398, partial [Chaetothyriales sp. CBS 134916]
MITEVKYNEEHAVTRITSDADGNRFSGSTSRQEETAFDEISHPARLPGEAEYLTGAKFWLVMLTLAAVLVLSSMDMNIVATAVPSITDYFHTVADFVLGKAYKLFSMKRVFLLANVISIAGSLLCRVATTSAMLIVGRAVTGLGSAGLLSGDVAHMVLRQKISQLDLASNLLLIPGLTCLFLAFSWAGTKHAWDSGPVIGPLVAFVVLLAAFVYNQNCIGPFNIARTPPTTYHQSIEMGFLGDKYKQWQNFKNGRNADGSSKISDEDLHKHTGMNRAELDKFAANTPGVAGNQNAGSITAGDASGLYSGAYSTYDGHKIPKK